MDKKFYQILQISIDNQEKQLQADRRSRDTLAGSKFRLMSFFNDPGEDCYQYLVQDPAVIWTFRIPPTFYSTQLTHDL